MDKCVGCLWSGECYFPDGCEHYTPVDEQEYLDDYVKARSEEFIPYWQMYAAEYTD